MKCFLIALAASLISPTAFASYEYKCFGYYWNGDEHESGTMTLLVDEDHATGDVHAKNWNERFGGNRDENYKSRGSIKYLKFGHELILEEVLIGGGKILRDGTLGGFARAEGEAEGGFYQYKFICKR